MKFTVYRTTNLINGRYYIGVHKTVEPNDGYLGSGKLIKRAIAKYGEENFRKEVLFVCDVEAEAFKKEFELVEIAKGDKQCYNLRQGGSGGFEWINRNGLHSTVEGRQKLKELLVKDPLFLKRAQKKFRAENPEWVKKSGDNGRLNFERLHEAGINGMQGRHHTLDAKRRMGENRKGSRNGRFGKKWMYHPKLQLSKPFTPEEIKTRLIEGWHIGRKISFAGC